MNIFIFTLCCFLVSMGAFLFWVWVDFSADKNPYVNFFNKVKSKCKSKRMLLYINKAEKNLSIKDFFFLTEILNDLYRYGFVESGKACTMLRDWKKELKQKCKKVIPGFVSKKRKLFDAIVGRQNW